MTDVRAPVSLRFPTSTRQNMSGARNTGSALYCIETSYSSGRSGGEGGWYLYKRLQLYNAQKGVGIFIVLLKWKKKIHIFYIHGKEVITHKTLTVKEIH